MSTLTLLFENLSKMEAQFQRGKQFATTVFNVSKTLPATMAGDLLAGTHHFHIAAAKKATLCEKHSQVLMNEMEEIWEL